MNKIKCKGIIIDRKEYGEADIQLDIFTDILGRVKIYVKGIRKTKNRQIGSMDLLCCSEMLIVEKKEDYNLSQFELLEPFLGIKKDLEKIGIATYLLEIIKKTNHTVERREGEFKLFYNSLKFIENSNNKQEQLVLIAYFLFKVIQQEGIIFSTVKELFQNEEEKQEKTVFQEGEREILEKIIKNTPKEIDYSKIKEENILNLVYILEEYINLNLDIDLEFKIILENYF